MKEIHKVKPYTYLIKHKKSGRVYYGSRCQNYTKYNRTPAEDFWKYYTTSSDSINNIINNEGREAFEYEIRRTFDSVEEMAKWETKVLIRCRVLKKQNLWFNANVAGKKILTESGAKKISEAHKDKPKTKEHRDKLSQSNVGKKKGTRSQQYREKMSIAKSGENNPRYNVVVEQTTRDKISAKNKGKTPVNKNIPMSREQKNKIAATKEKNKVMLTCVRCSKTMRESHYKIYKHGSECKL
jgi:hypothetical protein